jgi:hypothetical protein
VLSQKTRYALKALLELGTLADARGNGRLGGNGTTHEILDLLKKLFE